MAQWVRRPRSDGGESIQIKWRQDGRWQSETFTDVRLAAEFRTAVEAADHRWPEGWTKSEGWEAAEPPKSELTLAEVATGPEGYFAQQGKRLLRGTVKPYTIHRSKRLYELHVRNWTAPACPETLMCPGMDGVGLLESWSGSRADGLGSAFVLDGAEHAQYGPRRRALRRPAPRGVGALAWAARKVGWARGRG